MHAHMWGTTDGCSELLRALERVAAWIWPKKTAAFEPGEFEIPSGWSQAMLGTTYSERVLTCVLVTLSRGL